MKPTKDEIRAALAAIQVLAEAVREAGQIPTGHLYATVMSVMDLVTFESFIARLVGAKLIERRNNLLVWVGPEKIA